MTTAHQDTPVHSRPLQGDADYWLLRDLLVATTPAAPPCFNWDVRRLDGKRFYHPDPDNNPRWQTKVQLWETAEGRLVGAVNYEGPGDAHFQVDPDYRFLEPEMLVWAEEHLAAPSGADGRRQLELYVYEYDAFRQRLLERAGYEKTPWWGMTRRLRLGRQPLAKPVLAPGYTLRSTRPDDMADCTQIADLLNDAFNRTIHNAREYAMFASRAPCFAPDMDLVAVAPDGSLAAYVGIPYEETNRRGIFEPVCTHPDHRRKGLALALMQEGLLSLRARGAVDAIVDTGDMEAANQLYETAGFTEAYRGYVWTKKF